jgi:hypothetical protein
MVQVWDAGSQAQVPLAEPLRDAVWPLWTGDPSAHYVDGFASNLVAMAAPAWVDGLTPRWRFLQMLPLVMAQCLAIAVIARSARA